MKYVITHPQDGIYVGDIHVGSAWSKIDIDLPNAVMTFSSREEAKQHLSSLTDVGDLETYGYEFHPVFPSPRESHATVDDLREAGLDALLGNLNKASQRAGRCEPWEMTFDEFTGTAMIGEGFATSGRNMEQYGWLWEIASDQTNLGEAQWFNKEGYAVREALDCEPAGTFILLSPTWQACGFYTDPGLWIDPEHRGKGLATPLILAAAAFHGGSPTNNDDILGFSSAGYEAHQRAHYHAVREAFEAGKPVPERVLAEYGLGSDPQTA